MKRALCLLLLGLWAAAAGRAALAEDRRNESSLVCNGNILSVGESKLSAQEKCGPPTMKDEGGNLWMYNFGPGQFVYYVTFWEGSILRIESGDYGK